MGTLTRNFPSLFFCGQPEKIGQRNGGRGVFHKQCRPHSVILTVEIELYRLSKLSRPLEARWVPWSAAGSVSATPLSERILGRRTGGGICTGGAKAVSSLVPRLAAALQDARTASQLCF